MFKKESARIVVTDGRRVAMSRDADGGKIKMIGGKIERRQTARQAAVEELEQEALGRLGKVEEWQLRELPEQKTDPGYIAHWFGLIVSTELLNQLVGPGGDDVESIFLAEINEVEDKLHYKEWREWWRTLGKPAIELIISGDNS